MKDKISSYFVVEDELPVRNNQHVSLLHQYQRLSGVMIFFLVATASCQCQGYLSNPLPSSNCQVNGGVSNCVIDYTAEINIPFRASSCLTLTDSYGITLAVIEINFKNLYYLVSLGNTYWTSEFTYLNYWNLRCAGQPNSCIDHVCDDSDVSFVINNNDPTLRGNNLNPISVASPGRSFAFSSQQTYLQCPLSLISRSHVFCRSTFSYGALSSVSRQLNTNISPEFDISVTFRNGSVFRDTLTYSNEPLNIGIGYLTYLGNLNVPFLSSISGMKVMSNGNTWHLIEASDSGFPQSGMIGDIQMNSAAENFIYDNNMITMNPNTLDGDCNFNVVPSILTAYLRNPTGALPKNIGDTLWEVSDGILKGTAGSYSNALLRFDTSLNVTFTNTVTPICPEIGEEYIAGGVSKTDGGAFVQLNLKSTCGVGFANVISSSNVTVVTKQVYLNPDFTNTTIYLTSWTSLVLNLTIYSGIRSDYIIVDLNLIEPNNTNYGNNNATGDAEQSSGGDKCNIFCAIDNMFADVFNGIASALEYVIVVILLVIGAIALVIIVILIIYLAFVFLRLIIKLFRVPKSKTN